MQGIVNSLAAVLIYLPASSICGRRTGLIAAALFALSPNFIIYSIALTPGSFAIFLIILLIRPQGLMGGRTL